MYKYDTHIHTAEVSPCGRVTANELVHLYKDAGYDGAIITDHYCKDFFDNLSVATWTEKINAFLIGYQNALAIGKQIDLTVLPGMEIRFFNSPNDYLVYGINKAFLLHNPRLYLLTAQEFKPLAEQNGLIIYQAHPFRPHMTPMTINELDGIEVYNGNPRHNSYNDLALEYAQSNRLKMLSGSDFHNPEDLGRGGILTESRIGTSERLIQILKTQNIELFMT